MKVIHYPYLSDKLFLKEFDALRIKEQFVKIVVLDWIYEMPLAEIQGKSTGGSINVNGKSNMRRTASLNIIADEKIYNVTDVRNQISINKKVEVEVGFLNKTGKYLEYPILWFPEGVYVIQNATAKEDNNGISISLDLSDKMCLLNGQCGGLLPAAVNFDSTQVTDENGNLVEEELVLIYDIIKHVVRDYGGEAPERIIINDIDNEIISPMQWIGDQEAYLDKSEDGGEQGGAYFLKVLSDYFSTKALTVDDLSTLDESITYYKEKNKKYPYEIEELKKKIQKDSEVIVYTLDKDPASDSNIQKYEYGEDVGFVYSDFTYPEKLACNVGENVTTVLDKIKNSLGNYEYFYDIYGNFIFQEIKNYLNTTEAAIELEKGLSPDSYFINKLKGKSEYVFEDGSLITSYSQNPQYGNIKNDFVIWGQRSKDSAPIHYHLAIDSKPETGHYYFVMMRNANVSKDSTLMRAEPIDVKIINQFSEMDNPESNVWYYLNASDDTKGFYKWNVINSKIKTAIHTQGLKDDEGPKIVKTHDWREDLYYEGMKERQKYIYNFYNEEMAAFWPLVFNPVAEKIADSNYTSPVYKGAYLQEKIRDLEFYIDFIDTEGAISDFHIKNIGKRTRAITDTSINCLFAPETPNFVIIPVLDANSKDEEAIKKTEELRKKCQQRGQPYIQVAQYVYEGLAQSGYLNSAYNYVRNLLYQTLTYNDSITLNILPIYYLEANTRITVRNKNLGINGDYMIDSFNIPLDTNSTMSLQCSRALERV